MCCLGPTIQQWKHKVKMDELLTELLCLSEPFLSEDGKIGKINKPAIIKVCSGAAGPPPLLLRKKLRGPFDCSLNRHLVQAFTRISMPGVEP